MSQHPTQLCGQRRCDQFSQVGLPWERIKGLVPKETVVLRERGSGTREVGFINAVDNVNWPPYKDSKS